MDWAEDTVRVRVPATSANLGPGFDALGLALSLYDDVEAWVSPSGLSIEISGEGANLAAAGEVHLVVRAMRATFAVTGSQPPGIGLRCVNRIPHGRGLGSSAAAVVAGILAARALSGSAAAKLPDDALLGLASDMEGHPNNVAACLAGGLTIAWSAPAARAWSGWSRALPPVVCIAPAPVRTDVARGLLPEMVPHRDAAQRRAQRAAGRRADAARRAADRAAVLLDATRDWLHQDYRASAMPGTHALVQGLRAAGLPAVVSGPALGAGLPRRPGQSGLSSPPGQPGFNRERNGYWMARKLTRRRAAWCACPAAGAPAGLLTRETSG